MDGQARQHGKKEDIVAASKPRLKGQVAIITGSDSGIGRATAILFAKEGADVAIARHKDARGAEETKRAVEEQGRNAVVLELDQKDSASVKRFFEGVRTQLGTPRILVNDAGVDSTGDHVQDMSDEDWDRVIRTNLHGPFYFCREFVKTLVENGEKGAIINITSIHDEIPRAGAAGYCASKGALKELTKCLALEVAEKGIRVNNLAPGMVLTPMNQGAIEDPEKLEKAVQSIPMKRAAEPEEIARVALFLASDDASYIHGATIVADGALKLFQGQGA